MKHPNCGNEGHAQAASIASNDNKSTFQTILIGLLHDIRGLMVLVEADRDSAQDLRDLKQAEAILLKLLKRS